MSFLSNLFSNDRSMPKDSGISSARVTKTYPFYIKATVVLFGLVLFFYILMLLRYVLVPLCFAALIAILLNPLINRMLK